MSKNLFFDILANDRTGRAFSSLRNRLEGTEARLRVMRTAFVAVAGAATLFGGALVAAARAGGLQIDATAKAARRLGGSLAGYRALEMAADDAGVSLSSLANDVQTLNRELARAEVGQGAAGEALQRMGLAASDFSGLDADQRVAMLADRVKELGLDSGQTTLLLRDLGIRNREMALLVMQGGDALRQARVDVNDYGLALSDVDAAKIEAANDAISGLGDIVTYVGDQLALKMVPALGAMATRMNESLRAGGLLRAVLDAMLGSLERVGVYAATFVAFLGGRYVAAMVAARVATFSLVGGLAALRVALIRTGIGAIIVIAGELILRFSRLVESAGGFGNALGLLKNLAVEAFGRMKLASSSLLNGIAAAWFEIKSSALNSLAATVSGTIEAGNRIIGVFRGAFNAIKSIWSALPAAIGDFAFQAANALISGVEGMLNAVVTRINAFVSGLNSALALLPDWATGGDPISIGAIGEISLGDIPNRFAGQAESAGAAASEAFRRGFDENTFSGDAAIGLRNAAQEASVSAAARRGLSSIAADAATAPLQSLAPLRSAVTEVADVTLDAADAVDVLDDSLTDIGGAGGSAGSAGGAMEAMGNAATTAMDAAADAAKALKDRVNEGADAFANMFVDIATKAKTPLGVLGDLLTQMLRVQAINGFRGLASNLGGGAFGLLGGLLTPIGANANGTSNWRGGLTSINERGGEIVDLPQGTRIYPHDVSQRMAQGGQGGTSHIVLHVGPEFDARVASVAGPITVETVRENNRQMAQARRRA